MLIVFHVLFLHETGRRRRCGRRDRELKVKLLPYYVIKDVVNLSLFSLLFSFCCLAPFSLGDCENLKEANLMRRPVHIQPEWYFLLAYAILRAIPNKLGGVVALGLSVVCIWALCCLPVRRQSNYTVLYLFIFSLFRVVIVVLTFLGASPVETPLILFSQLLTCGYLLVLFLVFVVVVLSL